MKLTFVPKEGTGMGSAISAIVQLISAGMAQGHRVVDDGVEVHLWPDTANRVIEMGGAEKYQGEVERMLGEKGLALAKPEAPEEKAAEE